MPDSMSEFYKKIENFFESIEQSEILLDEGKKELAQIIIKRAKIFELKAEIELVKKS